MINMKSLPKKELIRLEEYDCVQCGVFYITICAIDRYELFVTINNVGAASCRPSESSCPPEHSCRPSEPSVHPRLTQVGKVVDYEIDVLSRAYEGVTVDNYVIMPNHVHMILRVVNHEKLGSSMTDAVSRMISRWKRAVSLKSGFSPWQKSFYRYVIRNKEEYWIVSDYIDSNPAR
jgi:REP element-mobilizing transposase RayT